MRFGFNVEYDAILGIAIAPNRKIRLWCHLSLTPRTIVLNGQTELREYCAHLRNPPIWGGGNITPEPEKEDSEQLGRMNAICNATHCLHAMTIS